MRIYEAAYNHNIEKFFLNEFSEIYFPFFFLFFEKMLSLLHTKVLIEAKMLFSTISLVKIATNFRIEIFKIHIGKDCDKKKNKINRFFYNIRLQINLLHFFRGNLTN